MTKKFVIILIIIMVSSFILAGITFSATGGLGEKQTITVDQEKVLSMSDVNSVSIKSVSSDINFILVDDTDEIKAKFYGIMNCFVCEPKFSLEGKKDSTNNITIESKRSSYGLFYFNTNLKLDIYLPKTYAENLFIDTVSGDVNVSSLNLKKFNVKTISGDLEFDSLNYNDSTLNTVSGDFTGSNIDGDISYHSFSGDIELTDFYGTFDGDSVSGDYDLEVMDEIYRINIDSASGDIDLNLSSDARSFYLTFNSASGDVEHNLTITIPSGVTNSDHHFEGVVGDGDNKITVHTVSGCLAIK